MSTKRKTEIHAIAEAMATAYERQQATRKQLAQKRRELDKATQDFKAATDAFEKARNALNNATTEEIK